MSNATTSDVSMILSGTSLTVIIDGEANQIGTDTHVIADVRNILNKLDSPEGLTDEDVATLKDLLDPTTGTGVDIDGTQVTIHGNEMVSYKGRRIPAPLERYVLDIVAAGLPTGPLRKFIQRIYSNPLEMAQEELILFLQSGKMSITTDGCFLAYKRITDDYKDCHSRTFDNSVGTVVSMPRQDVDTLRTNLCSTGLHFCSKDYLHSGAMGSLKGRVVIVKVDPADVVSIPADYSNTKGRTWRYEVVSEVGASTAKTDPETGVTTTDPEALSEAVTEHTFDAVIVEAGTPVTEVVVDENFSDDFTATDPEADLIPERALGEAVTADGNGGREGAFQTPPPARPEGTWKRIKKLLG